MAIFSAIQGEIDKLKIIPCSDAEFQNEVTADTFQVMYNPSTVNIKFQIDRDDTQADGATSATMNFKRIKPQDYNFDFVIDGTGASGITDIDVPEQVEKFLKTVYQLDGDIHQPRYCKILYGSVLLKCVLKSADVQYNLFNAQGKPLRVKITSVFTSCLDQSLSEMINGKSSPDLTHKREVKSSDKLIKMSNKIYQRNDLYVQVARANDLNTFRQLPAGSNLFFPPIDKS